MSQRDDRRPALLLVAALLFLVIGLWVIAQAAGILGG